MSIEKKGINLNKSKVNEFFSRNASVLSILGALIILCILWSFMSPYFLTINNFINIGTYISANGILAAGLTVAMLLGGLDLSHMAVMALSGMALGILYEQGYPPVVFISCAILTGCICGLINATIITYLRIIPIIATMGTQFIFRSFAFLSTNARNIPLNSPVLQYIGFGTFLGIPVMLWIMGAVCVLISLFLKYTQTGRNIYSVGGSEMASYLSGVNIRRTKFIAYIISGACSGIASLLYVSQSMTSMPNSGQGNEMNQIAAVVLGGLSLTGGKGTIGGTVIGILMLAIIANGMTLLSLSPYLQMLIKGAVLIIAVFLDAMRSKSDSN